MYNVNRLALLIWRLLSMAWCWKLRLTLQCLKRCLWTLVWVFLFMLEYLCIIIIILHVDFKDFGAFRCDGDAWLIARSHATQFQLECSCLLRHQRQNRIHLEQSVKRSCSFRWEWLVHLTLMAPRWHCSPNRSRAPIDSFKCICDLLTTRRMILWRYYKRLRVTTTMKATMAMRRTVKSIECLTCLKGKCDCHWILSTNVLLMAHWVHNWAVICVCIK